jgi:hypothetical protein
MLQSSHHPPTITLIRYLASYTYFLQKNTIKKTKISNLQHKFQNNHKHNVLQITNTIYNITQHIAYLPKQIFIIRYVQKPNSKNSHGSPSHYS